MMETSLTGEMNDELVDELTKVAQRFKGKVVRVIIVEVIEGEHKTKGKKNVSRM